MDDSASDNPQSKDPATEELEKLNILLQELQQKMRQLIGDGMLPEEIKIRLEALASTFSKLKEPPKE